MQAADFTGKRVSPPAGNIIASYLPPGAVAGYSFDLPADDYHGIGAFNASAIPHLLRSPAHYKAWRAEPYKTTPAKALGELIHMAILEPARFDLADAYYVEPARAKGAKRTPDVLQQIAAAQQLGKLVVEQEDVDVARRVAAHAHRHPIAAELLAGARPEVTLLWYDPQSGAPCKARFDALVQQSRAGTGVLDVKSTADAAHDEFAKSAANYLYHAQAAWYLHAHEVVYDRTPDFYAWLAVESSVPHGVALYLAQADAVNAGRAIAFEALSIYADAWQRGDWPGYSQLAQPLQLPRWALRADAETRPGIGAEGFSNE